MFFLAVESKVSSNCPCVPLGKCGWAQNLLSFIRELPTSNTNRIKVVTFLRKQVMKHATIAKYLIKFNLKC